MSDEILTELEAGVLTVTFARPHRHNAMTWGMYDGLRAAVRRVGEPGEEAVDLVVLRGAGGRAFVAGTDIAQFAAFAEGADGVRYERAVAAVLEDLLALEVPVVAVVEGLCVGAGLALAACADLVVATPGSRFGVPIARTVGNTLSAHTLALLGERLGVTRVTDLLLTARLLDVTEAREAGLVARVAEDADAALAELVATLRAHAPLTLRATVTLQRRLRAERRAHPGTAVDDGDVVARVYGSDDFREGVAAFGEHRAPRWSGG